MSLKILCNHAVSSPKIRPIKSRENKNKSLNLIAHEKIKIYRNTDRCHFKEHEHGKKVGDLCREHGIADQTFYNWKAKYGGMYVNELRRVKELEEENTRLKRIVANMTLEIDAMKHVYEKKFGGLPRG